MSSQLRTILRAVLGKGANKQFRIKYNGAFKHQRRSKRTKDIQESNNEQN